MSPRWRFGSIPIGRGPLAMIATQALLLNVLLAVFNMLPIPPLDGGQIMMALAAAGHRVPSALSL